MEQFPQEKARNNDALLKNLSDILLKAVKKTEDVETFHDSIVEFALGLGKKYPDARSRRLWHLLIGSTPPPGIDMNMEDYPGNDSIVRFIEGLNPAKI
ncbi:MAG: hypothetical protein V1711_02530 [bacterium]